MKKIVGVILFAAVLLMACSFDGCDTPQSTDTKVANKQEQMQQDAMQQTGLPGIVNFTELKMVKHLYELRDQSIATFTYVPDYEGRLWHVCDSVGFGIPYATQFSNPEKVEKDSQYGYGTLPQSEPNGLFMPASAEGTWVNCADPKSGKPQPIYIEPRVVVSPFRLHAFGEWAEK